VGRLDVAADRYRDYPIAIAANDSRRAISTVTLAFDAMPNTGPGFRLDRLSVR
jgi:hypothetical protein